MKHGSKAVRATDTKMLAWFIFRLAQHHGRDALETVSSLVHEGQDMVGEMVLRTVRRLRLRGKTICVSFLGF
jgi:hypothetical protein